MKVNFKRLVKEMARQCLNSCELSKISGVSVSTISRLKLEGAETRGKTLGLIAKALKLDIDDLIAE